MTLLSCGDVWVPYAPFNSISDTIAQILTVNKMFSTKTSLKQYNWSWEFWEIIHVFVPKWSLVSVNICQLTWVWLTLPKFESGWSYPCDSWNRFQASTGVGCKKYNWIMDDDGTKLSQALRFYWEHYSVRTRIVVLWLQHAALSCTVAH